MSTYRLQLQPGFDFAAAQRLLPYIKSLGLGTLYLSPVFAAVPGTTHGYDVVDMTSISPELGGEDAYRSLCKAAADVGLEVLQDIVPNHRAFHSSNSRLMNLLENGTASPYHSHYDIYWDHPYENIRGRVLAPFLGSLYSHSLENGEIKLSFLAGGFFIEFLGQRFPVNLLSYAGILNTHLSALPPSSPDKTKLIAILTYLSHLEEERNRAPHFDHAGFVRTLLKELYESSELLRAHVQEVVELFNGKGETSEVDRFSLLDNLLDKQFFRLAYWKVGTEELNYRRFFAINGLISLRAEIPDVFEENHALVSSLCKERLLQGLRVDHVDGLFDPLAYLRHLRATSEDIYIVVEKILESGEHLPANWPVQGTTGYDFCNAVNCVLSDYTAVASLSGTYATFIQANVAYFKLVQDKKRAIINDHMSGDIDNLALQLKRITNRSREGKDLTMYALRQALIEILTLFPVYRTYVSPLSLREEDKFVLDGVFRRALEQRPRFREELQLIQTFVHRLFANELSEGDKADWIDFLMRLQQYTGPLMAKGVEDTVLYIYNRFVSRNEVGSEPIIIGCEPEDFHRFNSERLRISPLTMNATATHDTKRGEDVRARLAVISEDPEEWRLLVNSWANENPARKHSNNSDAPSKNDEYLLYQTILGAAPFCGFRNEEFQARVQEYMVKASREANENTSWLNPDNKYEQALLAFIGDTFGADGEETPFLHSFSSYLEKISFFGIFNSLSQLLLKITSPGVPDFYQGTELWDLSLVDPDNRRLVDYSIRQELLSDLRGKDENSSVDSLLDSPNDGRLKMFTLQRALAVRNGNLDLFEHGSYTPLSVCGEKSRHAIAFSRGAGSGVAVTIVPRFVSRLIKDYSLRLPPSCWNGTRVDIPAGGWRCAFTGCVYQVRDEGLDLGDSFQYFPVCLLTPE